MRTSHRTLLPAWPVCFLAVLTSIFAPGLFSGSQGPSSAEVPVVNGGAGTCSADFVVTDSSRKGLYDAKIRIQIRYGFLGLRRLELEVGTNSDGKARVQGLPERIRKPAEFKVQHGDQSKLIPYDPEANCHPRHEVALGEKQARQ